MAELPLIKDLKDLHYRYKMPKLVTKVESKGNGIRTVIVNMDTVSKALKRPAMYIAKFFSFELGANVSTHKNQYIINGEHKTDALINHLYSFINKFVICPKCKNPETDLEIQNRAINQTCRSCGNMVVIPPNIHRITNFIIKHPPVPSSKPTKSTASTILNEDRLEPPMLNSNIFLKSQTIGQKNGNQDDEWSDNEENNTSKIKIEDQFEQQKINSNSSSKNQTNEQKNENQADDWSDDEVSNTNGDKFSTAFNGLLIDKTPAEKAEMFMDLVNSKKNANSLDEVNIHKELFNEATRLGLKDKAPLVLAEALFTENMLKEIKKYEKLLLKFCDGNEPAQKSLLKAFEILVTGVYRQSLFGKIENILYKFYELDLIDEDVFIDWAENVTGKPISKEDALRIREKAARFIDWLKKPDSDSKEIQINASSLPNPSKTQKLKEDDDDIEIEYSHRVNGLKVEIMKEKTVDDSFDIDIDAI